MRIEWFRKKGSDRVILFFNGWGMDAAAVSHLELEEDVVMFYDYRSLNDDFPNLENYHSIVVVAWSMGVWAADRLLSTVKIHPEVCIALNGTTQPVDDEFGIPVKMYELTAKGMNERGREKFFLRMFEEKEEYLRFSQRKPNRSLKEVCEELCRIREESTGEVDYIKWDKSFISGKDVIFPVNNQLHWCRKQDIPVVPLTGGHYPFYHFQKWSEILVKL